MIAVAIIGILAAIALPSFNSPIKQNRMRLVVDTVVGDFRQSESLAQAAGAGQSVVLEISNPGASWTYTVTHSSSGSVLTRQASDFSGAISLSVTGSDFSDADSDGTTCTNPNGGQSGGFTCQTSTSLATLDVSGTADASQVLCSITPASPYAQTLSTAAPTLTVTLVVAQNSNKC